LKFNEKADLQYLAHLFEMISIRKYVTGIDQFKLNRKILDSIPIPIPPIELQMRFREILQKTESQKQRMVSSHDESGSLFNTLTQKLFRGDLSKQTETA